MFELSKQRIIEHFNFNETQQNGFYIEEDGNYQELTHPDLYFNIAKESEWFVGHYQCIPGHWSPYNGGEPDDFDLVTDFRCNTEEEAIDKLIELEDNQIASIEAMNEHFNQIELE